jgi:hypothetical protein
MNADTRNRFIRALRQTTRFILGARMRLMIAVGLAVSISVIAGISRPQRRALTPKGDMSTAVAVSEPIRSSDLSIASSVRNRPQADTKERIQIELVTVRTRGFEPSQITRSKGRFVLAVYNRSGLEEVNLHLDQEAGPKLRQERVPRTKLDWYSGLDLPPGKYFLTEANHPAWRCTIIVTPN